MIKGGGGGGGKGDRKDSEVHNDDHFTLPVFEHWHHQQRCMDKSILCVHICISGATLKLYDLQLIALAPRLRLSLQI